MSCSFLSREALLHSLCLTGMHLQTLYWALTVHTPVTERSMMLVGAACAVVHAQQWICMMSCQSLHDEVTCADACLHFHGVQEHRMMIRTSHVLRHTQRTFWPISSRSEPWTNRQPGTSATRRSTVCHSHVCTLALLFCSTQLARCSLSSCSHRWAQPAEEHMLTVA